MIVVYIDPDTRYADYLFTDDIEDVFQIARDFGEDQIVCVIHGKKLTDVTEEVLEQRPKAFPIEVDLLKKEKKNGSRHRKDS